MTERGAIDVSRQLVATIDCGTSNVRCIVFDIHTGEKVCVTSRDWYVPEENGVFYFDDITNWKLLCECTRSALSQVNKEELVCLTATGFRHGIFCTAKDTDEVIFGCFNMDVRCDNSYLAERNLNELVYETAGDWSSLHGISRLLWLKKHEPERFERIKKFMFVSDWVLYKMCGEIASEPGNASSSLLLDISTRDWSEDLRIKCGFPSEIYPTLADAGTVLGKVGRTAAAETGFPEGLKVVCGVADTQAGLVGVGACTIGTSAIVGGSYWLDCYITDTPKVDPEYRTRLSCHSVGGQWVYEGLGFYTGLTIRWFRDAFGQQEKQIAEEYGIDAFYLLDRLAASVPPGSYGLQSLFADISDESHLRMAAPTFMGWDVLRPAKSHKGVFFRSMLESSCYQAYGEYKKIARILDDQAIPENVILSGGAAKSKLWGQILCDVLNKPVYLTKESEATSLGAAIHAATGTGIYDSIQEATDQLVAKSVMLKPDQANHEVYMTEFARWRELYKNALELLDRGLVKGMFQVDGTFSEEQIRNPWKLK